MTYGDICRAVTKTLKELFPKHYIYSLARAELDKRPAFSFYIKPVLVEAANRRTRHNILSLYITYFQQVKDEGDMYDVMTMIRDALGWSYKVGDSYIYVTGFDWNLVGKERDTPEMDITLEYFETIDNDEHADPMTDVSVKVKMKEEYA